MYLPKLDTLKFLLGIVFCDIGRPSAIVGIG